MHPPDESPVVVLTAAAKTYGPILALDRLTLEIRPSEVLALLGPNGAGKTTTIQLLLGLARPTSGSARLFGRDPQERGARARLGAMLQVGKVPETLAVRELLRLFASYYPRPLPTEETIRRAGIGEFVDRRFGVLSGGQQRRALFGLALCGNPDLLVLDEPTTGLDIESRRSLWAAVRAFRARGGSVLLTTHHLEEADALADRIVLLARGREVASGTPAEIKASVDGANLEEAYLALTGFSTSDTDSREEAA
ncbi:MAG TPA: ABC transporter ATP-binding protein [Thermoanaerobaculia bacterium]|jgi:ABC-2 type transport system ATP-binding protein|nr:ABC transporter ATP-binding protein [Thermoanaerobaculia bacterium]